MDGGTSPEVGSIQEELVGRGASFWQPLRGEAVSKIHYCWLSALPEQRVRDIVSSALQSSWQSVALVDFFDDGRCPTSPGVRVQIFGDPSKASTSRLGTDTGGDYMWLPFPLTAGKPQGCGGYLDAEPCLTLAAVHEFGHVLGFIHEALRPEASTHPCVSPDGGPGFPPPDDERPYADSLITAYDQDSIMNRIYCSSRIDSALTQRDINGVRAVYGARPSPTSVSYTADFPGYYALRYQRPQPGPRSVNAWYLSPKDTRSVEIQTLPGPWERLRLFYLPSSSSAPTTVSYGDVVGITDVFGRWLSARDTFDVDMRDRLDAWEKWIIAPISGSSVANGTPVGVNAPVRLRSQQWPDRYLSVTSSGDVQMQTNPFSVGGSVAEWRFNGPLLKP